MGLPRGDKNPWEGAAAWWLWVIVIILIIVGIQHLLGH